MLLVFARKFVNESAMYDTDITVSVEYKGSYEKVEDIPEMYIELQSDESVIDYGFEKNMNFIIIDSNDINAEILSERITYYE